ncbi:MAG: DUF1446 domain-containing protein [Burkholderiaceae bacterium]|nr:DUF1446 domain-containing protein [Burkholderiaceae bacterium]
MAAQGSNTGNKVLARDGRRRTVRIGGASGYWGDSQDAPRQLVTRGDIDYLVFDYLAEVTMSVLVRAFQKDPQAGYARDFVELVMKPLLPEIKARGIRVIANAGGVNVPACARALAAVAAEAGVALRIGTVEGDDLLPREAELRERGVREMFSGAPLPARLASANAYLGARPIAAALDAGADVVITGRCVDSAVTLGPLVHEFGWGPGDLDRLAAGTIAGHIIECGAQATGGNFTDWREVAAGWADMGYPIAECDADGGVVITKPEGTGGRVSRFTVGEQLLYEIGDPARYVVPDVVCDVSDLALDEIAPDRVRVSGVRGHAPTDSYKVSATWADGFRATALTVLTGFDVVEKANAFSGAVLERTRRLFAERGWGDYRRTATHLIGAETLWGANARAQATATREITLRMDVHHDNYRALDLFSKEYTGVALAMTTGRCAGGAAGRPKVTPVVAQFAFLVPKAEVLVRVRVDGAAVPLAEPVRIAGGDGTARGPLAEAAGCVTGAPGEDSSADGLRKVPLVLLAVARSGDKGDDANIGVIARRPDYLPWIQAQLTPERVRRWFAHTVRGDVHRYALPALGAFNFVLKNALDGGGTSSLHLDSQAKTYAQQLLAIELEVPAAIADQAEARA